MPYSKRVVRRGSKRPRCSEKQLAAHTDCDIESNFKKRSRRYNFIKKM